jgi:uncharacterized protein YdaU (DUF1376 family)
MARTDTWMPLYIGDYLSDTMRLTTLQHGAYLLLLMEYWKQGPLPNDDDELAAIVKIDRPTWDASISKSIRRFFTANEDGTLRQKRVDQERGKAIELSEKRSSAARQPRKPKPSGGGSGGQGGSKSEANDEQLHEQLLKQKQDQLHEQNGDDADATLDDNRSSGLFSDAKCTQNPQKSAKHRTNPKQLHEQLQTHAGAVPPSPSQLSKKDTPPLTGDPKAKIGVTFPDWLPKDAWDGFMEVRRAKKAPYTTRAIGNLIADLDAMRIEGFDPTVVLDQSTTRGWTGLFRPKGDFALIRGGRAPAGRLDWMADELLRATPPAEEPKFDDIEGIAL